jgi:hypothetical protein
MATTQPSELRPRGFAPAPKSSTVTPSIDHNVAGVLFVGLRAVYYSTRIFCFAHSRAVLVLGPAVTPRSILLKPPLVQRKEQGPPA